MYMTLKMIHVAAATLTISGFMLRGHWMLKQSPLLDRPAVRIVPHVVDTVFLLSGIGLIVVLRLPVLNQPWLLTKFAALVIYILLGMVALRRGRTMRNRATAFWLAVVTFAYIVGVAMNKSTASWAAAISL